MTFAIRTPIGVCAVLTVRSAEDTAAQSYLRVIAALPDEVSAALEKA